MTAPAEHLWIGTLTLRRSRTAGSQLREPWHPAMITIGGNNNGEVAFSALQAGLNLSPSIVHYMGRMTRWTQSHSCFLYGSVRDCCDLT
ncbi:MAG: hypothetical protein EOS34_32400 [Mesorhizobium sp.]|nr:MAG: hypothetical protein EOS34_32400 [Mesorhizobium sp.]